MTFTFDTRPAESSYVDFIWRTQSAGVGSSFLSTAATQSEIVVTRQPDKTTITVRGPETLASPAPIPENTDFLGIVLKLGTFMPPLPTKTLVNGGVNLPEASSQTFWLHGDAWQFPTFENADVFIQRLLRNQLLAHDTVVADVLRGRWHDISLRTIQRRFVQATGITHTTIYQIERAKRAMTLLQSGLPILDVVEEAGYADQPHLTRALRRYMGQTPAEILWLKSNA